MFAYTLARTHVHTHALTPMQGKGGTGHPHTENKGSPRALQEALPSPLPPRAAVTQAQAQSERQGQAVGTHGLSAEAFPRAVSPQFPTWLIYVRGWGQPPSSVPSGKVWAAGESLVWAVGS